MNLLDELLGFFSGAGSSPGTEGRAEFTRLWHGTEAWIAAFVILGAGLLVVVLYRKEKDLGRFQRLALAGLRLAALAVVVFMLLDPRVLTEIRRERLGQTLLLLDTSGSMSQSDSFEGSALALMEEATGLSLDPPVTRGDLMAAALERHQVLPQLSEKNRLRLFAFDAKLRELDKLDARELLPPAGLETRLGDALRGAVKQAGGDPVAAIVVVSDGRVTGGEPLPAAAEAARLEGIPVHTVGIGRSRLPKNFAVTDLSAPEVVAPGFPIRIQARVEGTGLRGPAKVRLFRAAGGGSPVKIDEQDVAGNELGFSSAVIFVDTLERVGTCRYVVSIPYEGVETSASDNERDVQVTAAEEKCRVLLVAGEPSFEYIAVQRFLTRDPGIQASVWLSTCDRGRPQDGDVVIRELPRGGEGLRGYDVVLLLDPEPKTLTADFLKGLAEFVLEQGGGLAFVAGEAHAASLAGSASAGDLLKILPVELQGAAGGGSRGREAHVKGWRPRRTRQGAEHPLCRLADGAEESTAIWSALPPLYFSSGTRSLKPLATTLVEGRGGESILAVQKAGAGYSLFIGTDDLHRWRACRPGLHERFWAGVVRYLALGKKAMGSHEVTLSSDRDRYTLGDEIVFEATIVDQDRKPVSLDQVELIQEDVPAGLAGLAGGGPDSSAGKPALPAARLSLLPQSGMPGWYAGRSRAEKPGRFEARLSLGGKTSYLVTAPSTELGDPTPDHGALTEAAARTGGTFLELPEIGRLAGSIPEKKIVEIVGRASKPLWDTAGLLCIFCGLAILEWVLRKMWRLN
jgi:hypothetical protein